MLSPSLLPELWRTRQITRCERLDVIVTMTLTPLVSSVFRRKMYRVMGYKYKISSRKFDKLGGAVRGFEPKANKPSLHPNKEVKVEHPCARIPKEVAQPHFGPAREAPKRSSKRERTAHGITKNCNSICLTQFQNCDAINILCLISFSIKSGYLLLRVIRIKQILCGHNIFKLLIKRYLMHNAIAA